MLSKNARYTAPTTRPDYTHLLAASLIISTDIEIESKRYVTETDTGLGVLRRGTDSTP
jgi:hypothetical protein